MEYVRLGSTNLEVSRLGLGAMAFGSRRWRPWILEEAEAKPIIDRALDHGINFFDTSDYYSGGESEVVLGRCLLSRVAREQVVIATKVGNPMGSSVTERGYSRKHVMHAVDASLRRLGTDYIDLYQTHIWDPRTALEEMVIAFDDLIRAGKILHAGVTTLPAWQLAKCIGIAQRMGRRAFVSAQNHYVGDTDRGRDPVPGSRLCAEGVVGNHGLSGSVRPPLHARCREDGPRPPWCAEACDDDGPSAVLAPTTASISRQGASVID